MPFPQGTLYKYFYPCRIQHEHGSSLEFVEKLKTKSSSRIIKLPQITLRELAAHSIRQDAEKLLAGKEYNDEDLMFCTPLGHKLDTRHLYRLHCWALQNANIEHTAFHNLRHTVISWLADDNEPLTAIQALSGHADLKSLLGYVNPYTNMQESTINKLESIIEDIHNISENQPV